MYVSMNVGGKQDRGIRGVPYLWWQCFSNMNVHSGALTQSLKEHQSNLNQKTQLYYYAAMLPFLWWTSMLQQNNKDVKAHIIYNVRCCGTLTRWKEAERNTFPLFFYWFIIRFLHCRAGVGCVCVKRSQLSNSDDEGFLCFSCPSL